MEEKDLEKDFGLQNPTANKVERITKKGAAIEVYNVLEEARATTIMGIAGILFVAIMFKWVALAAAMAFCSILSYQLYKFWVRMNHLKKKYDLVIQSKVSVLKNKFDKE